MTDTIDTLKELTDAIDIINRAVAITSREMQKGVASMLQLRTARSIADALSVMVEASTLNTTDASSVAALVQDSHRNDDFDAGALAAAVYESQSGDIVDMSSMWNVNVKIDWALKELTSLLCPSLLLVALSRVAGQSSGSAEVNT